MSLQLSAVEALTEEESKIVLYLYILSSTNKPFSLKKFKEHTNIKDDRLIFGTIKLLYQYDFLTMHTKDSLLYFSIEGPLIEIKLDMPLFSFKIMNEELFMHDKEIFTDLIEDVYIPNQVYDGSYMASFLRSEKHVLKDQLKSVALKQKSDETKEKEAIRRRIRANSNVLLEYFYGILRDRYGKILTQSERDLEFIQMKAFVQKYSNKYDLETIKEGILWLLDHKFWGKVVSNVNSLNKNFIKFLIDKKQFEDTEQLRVL